MRPVRHLMLLPVAESFQSEVKEPVRFTLLLRYQTHHILVQSFVYHVGMDIGGEAVLILFFCHTAHKLIAAAPVLSPVSVLCHSHLQESSSSLPQ